MTAVEWLFEQLDVVDSSISYEYFEQANEMFEQQIIDAYETSHISMMTSKQYYNETFKSE
jgi:hypothetical protein